MKWVLPVIFVVFLFPSVVLAQNANEDFNESFLCRNAILRWLLRPNCPSQNPPPLPDQTSPTSRTGSLQLRSFEPPPTNTPTSTRTPTPTLSSISEQPTQAPGENFPTNTTTGSNTLQVDWVYNDQGICWSAWAVPACNLLPHEGGSGTGSVDIVGDTAPDVTCSQGDGSTNSTTITNISNQSISVRCERYTCNSCKSGNGTHAQCDGGIDPGASRVAQGFTLAPRTSATCTANGIGTDNTSIQPTSPVNQPNQPTQPKPPVPTKASPPPVPPQRPTPTLPPGNTPPISTKCRVGTGYCSVENLMKYFPSYTAAYKASVVCQGESASNPLAANTACLRGGTVDYSIGLFQINLLAHCDGAMTYTWTPPSCRIINQSKFEACKSLYQNPDANIKKAVALSKNGTDFYPTWGAAGPAYCNIP